MTHIRLDSNPMSRMFLIILELLKVYKMIDHMFTISMY